jgi:hypothetical protein
MGAAEIKSLPFSVNQILQNPSWLVILDLVLLLLPLLLLFSFYDLFFSPFYIPLTSLPINKNIVIPQDLI